MDNLIEDLLEGEVRGRGAKIKRIHKITQNAPEVMVKITGYSKGTQHMQSHLNYIGREGKLELEDEDGNIINTKDGFDNLIKEWSETSGKLYKNTRHTTNIVLSMPSSVEGDDVKNSVRDFAKKTFGKNHQYVMALHEDTDNPHVHLTVRNLGYDGKRLQIKNGDQQKWREAFAQSLELQGIEAEATSRAVRGVVHKSQSQAMIHMKENGVSLKRDKVILEDIENIWRQDAKDMTPRVWEKKIKDRQKDIREAWVSLADGYKESDPKLSEQILSFVSQMPEPKTKRERVNERIFASVLDQKKADYLLKKYPELKGDIQKILLAREFAAEKITDKNSRHVFMKKVVERVAHERLNGQVDNALSLKIERHKNNDREEER